MSCYGEEADNRTRADLKGRCVATTVLARFVAYLPGLTAGRAELMVFHMKRLYGSLYAEEEDGEGTVLVLKGFDRQTTTFRLDVLQDWIEQLIELSNELNHEVYKAEETTDGGSTIRG